MLNIRLHCVNIPPSLVLSPQGQCQGVREMIQTDSILLDLSLIAASEGFLCYDDSLYHNVSQYR